MPILGGSPGVFVVRRLFCADVTLEYLISLKQDLFFVMPLGYDAPLEWSVWGYVLVNVCY